MEITHKQGDLVSVAGISFPLTLLSINYNTNTASLGGENPYLGSDVMLPQVCVTQLRSVPAPIAIGQLAQLNSGGPLLTVTAIYPPEPFAPAGSPTLVDCMAVEEGGQFVALESLDERALRFKAADGSWSK